MLAPAFANISLLALLLICFLTAVLLFIVWHFSRSLPKTKKGKVGFVISISCDDETETKKIKADFVLTLRRLIKAGKTGSSFQFIEIPSFHSEKIVDVDDAQKLRIQTKAQFLLYGRVRVRQINKKEHHFIELDGLVSHKPIPDIVSKQLATEFSELLPRQVAISTEDDLLSFQFTSEWAELVAKYIIGLAAALSGDVVYAEQLYTDVLEKVTSNTNGFIVYEKLRQRLPIRLYEIYEARAANFYEKWATTHESHEIDNMGIMLLKIDFEKYKHPSIALLMSIYHFLHNRDIPMAQNWLNKYPKQYRNSTWQLNHAFLSAYEGDLRTAIRYYREGTRSLIESDIISKIEDFIYFVATNEANKYQLFFCLGFFNWKVKGDNKQATEDFEKFLHSGKETEFQNERKLAHRWLEEISKANAIA